MMTEQEHMMNIILQIHYECKKVLADERCSSCPYFNKKSLKDGAGPCSFTNGWWPRTIANIEYSSSGYKCPQDMIDLCNSMRYAGVHTGKRCNGCPASNKNDAPDGCMLCHKFIRPHQWNIDYMYNKFKKGE